MNVEANVGVSQSHGARLPTRSRSRKFPARECPECITKAELLRNLKPALEAKRPGQRRSPRFRGSCGKQSADSLRHVTTASAEATSADVRKCLIAGRLTLATVLPPQVRRRNYI
jgi:hypothetical protein